MINAIKTRIETTSFTETVDFYTRIIGLVVVAEFAEEEGVILAVRDKQSEGFLEIVKSKSDVSLIGVSIQLRTADADAFAKSLKGKVSFDGPKKRPWGSKYIYLTDPNGLEVIVFEGEV